jgi:malate dehydrogenase (oxaloacetate-decarboxylating)
MCFTAAKALAEQTGDRVSPEYIVPTMEEWSVFPHVAAAVALEAQAEGLARKTVGHDQLYRQAERIIRRSRELTRSMLEQGFIDDAPGGE